MSVRTHELDKKIMFLKTQLEKWTKKSMSNFKIPKKVLKNKS